METLFELEDEYKNSLKDFDMAVDYELAYLTTDGQSVPVLAGSTNVGSALYDPSTLPAVPPNFRCSQLITDVQCDFYTVNQTEREIFNTAPVNQKIIAQKRSITTQQRVMRIQSKVTAKIQALQNRFNPA
jgi:hypothetical protein